MTILKGSRRHHYGDGGPVVVEKPKMKPHVPPKVKDPIPKSTHKLKRVKKADGGKVYGTPMGLQKPSTRKRPQVGDKDPNYKPKKAGKKKPTPNKPAPKKKPGYNHRDYRGTAGAIEDAGG